jgi:hypothetical protein
MIGSPRFGMMIERSHQIYAIADRESNQIAFRRLAKLINQTYPHGRFVAIADGCVVADAPSFGELESALRSLGRDSENVLVVQAGVEYPESAVIFSDAVASSTQASSPEFQGLAGLPLLRLLEYGGDASSFWLRAATATP